MERAGGLLRAVSTHYILSLDKDINGSLTWKPVLETFSASSPEEIAAIEHNTGAALRNLVTDPDNNNSLKAIVGKARAAGAEGAIAGDLAGVVQRVAVIIKGAAG